MSSRNYRLAQIKLNNHQYLTQGSVSSSSRISRLRYNALSGTPVVNKTPQYDTDYRPQVFKKKHFIENTYYPGTKEGKRNKYYNYQSSKEVNKIVENACHIKKKYSKKSKIYIRTTFSVNPDGIDGFVNRLISSVTKNIAASKENIYINLDSQLLSNDEIGSVKPNSLSNTLFNTTSTVTTYYEGDVTRNNTTDVVDVQYILEWLEANKDEYIIRDPNTGEVLLNNNYNRDLVNDNTGNTYRLNTYQRGVTTIVEPVIPDDEKCNCDDLALDPSDTTNYQRLHLQIQSLYDNAGIFIDSLLQQFISGDLEGIKTALTSEFYNQLAIKLSDEKCERFPYYEHIRLLINRSLEILEKTIIIEADLQEELNRVKNELDQCRNPAAPLFELEAAIETVASIRPEYLKYIQLYGMPEGGVFDTEKLADVIKSLEND